MGVWKRLWRRLTWSPAREGAEGEEAVAEVLEEHHWFGPKGTVLRNVYIPRGQGTGEIDLLYLTTRGIFVIESKNYAGRIRGDERWSDWTRWRSVSGGILGGQTTDKLDFYNPIWQNRNHCKALASYLDQWEVPIWSVVVFADRCQLHVDWEDPAVEVCRLGQLRKRLKQVWRRTGKVLFKSQVRELAETLEPLSQVGRQVQRQHRREARRYRQTAAVCPLCGGRLVQRTVQHGRNRGQRFYGCENYPFCTYRRDL